MTNRSTAVPATSATAALLLRIKAVARRIASRTTERRWAAREEASRDPDGRSMAPGYHRDTRKNPERFWFIDGPDGAVLSGPAFFAGAAICRRSSPAGVTKTRPSPTGVQRPTWTRAGNWSGR